MCIMNKTYFHEWAIIRETSEHWWQIFKINKERKGFTLEDKLFQSALESLSKNYHRKYHSITGIENIIMTLLNRFLYDLFFYAGGTFKGLNSVLSYKEYFNDFDKIT